jgi:flagellar motor protein MotB
VQVAENTKLSPAEYEKVQKEIAETSARFELALAKHIQKKRIEVVKGTRSIILRIPIKVAFQKKKPRFRKSYAKVMRVLRKILEPSTYPIIAGCHTAEDLPPGKHRSHWTYSSACAGQLARSILRQDIVRPDRVQAHGYGNTRQLHPGAKGRKASQNLRMELELVFIP